MKNYFLLSPLLNVGLKCTSDVDYHKHNNDDKGNQPGKHDVNYHKHNNDDKGNQPGKHDENRLLFS
jgi:hypothetical protein